MRTAYIGGFLMVRLDSQQKFIGEKYCSRKIHDLHQVEPKTQPGLRTQLGFVLDVRVEVGLVGRRRCPGSWCGVECTMLLSCTLFSASCGSDNTNFASRRCSGGGEMRDWVVVVVTEEEECGTDKGCAKCARPGASTVT